MKVVALSLVITSFKQGRNLDSPRTIHSLQPLLPACVRVRPSISSNRSKPRKQQQQTATTVVTHASSENVCSDSLLFS